MFESGAERGAIQNLAEDWMLIPRHPFVSIRQLIGHQEPREEWPLTGTGAH
jgi:hypothetical protein